MDFSQKTIAPAGQVQMSIGEIQSLDRKVRDNKGDGVKGQIGSIRGFDAGLPRRRFGIRSV